MIKRARSQLTGDHADARNQLDWLDHQIKPAPGDADGSPAFAPPAFASAASGSVISPARSAPRGLIGGTTGRSIGPA
jgi:hypothetical protein